ncbi:putative Hydrogenase-4 component G [Candidatus Magnetomoraceae bacterium gMMP-15]
MDITDLTNVGGQTDLYNLQVNEPKAQQAKDQKALQAREQTVQNKGIDADQTNAETARIQTNQQIIEQFQGEVETESKNHFGLQAGLTEITEEIETDYSRFTYNDKSLTEILKEEASQLIDDDGYFGIENTAQRLVNFVFTRAGNDIEQLQRGREAMVRGFKKAEAILDENVPAISYDTLNRALEKLDVRIKALGGNILDINA